VHRGHRQHRQATTSASRRPDAAHRRPGRRTPRHAGKVTFGEFAEQWLAGQTVDASTCQALEVRLRVHLLPTFGGQELRAIRPSSVQAWLSGLQQQLASSYVRVLLANLSES